jgi:hypothetical protein
MTDRDPALRPTCAQVASDLHAIVGGGQATTVIEQPTPVSARTQVIDRTQLLTTAVPSPPVPAAEPVRQAVTPVAVRPPRNNWTLVFGIVLALAVLVVAGLLVGRSSGGGGAVPDKVSVHGDVPAPIQRDVKRLQQVVDEHR